MAGSDKSREVHFPAIEKKHGEPMAHWHRVMKTLGGRKYAEQIAYLREEHGFSQTHANALVMYSRGSTSARRVDTPEAFFDALPSQQAATMRSIFSTIRKKYPSLELVIAWNQPMLKHGKDYVFGVSAAKNHLLLGPWGDDAVARAGSLLDGYDLIENFYYHYYHQGMSLRVWAAATAIASLFIVVPSQPVLAASGWDVVDSYYDSANAPSIGGGFNRVNRWNAPDGSVYVMGNAVGATTAKISHLSPPGVAFTRDDFTIGPGLFELPCYLDYACTVVDVAFDAQNRAYFVGAAVKPFVETVGFVLVLDRNENVVARAHKQVDGFDFLFRLVEFDETTGDLIVGGSSFSDFDSEERAVVVRINAIPLPADGQLTFDRSFDGDGVAVIDLGVNTLLRDVMANPDGSVYVLVRMLTVSDGKPITVVRKLSAVGVADRSFGLSGNGYPLGLSTSTPGNLARGSDGLYVLVKTDKAQVSIYEPRIIRMTLTGRVDTTFSGDGQVVFDALDSTWAGSPTEEFKVVFTLAGVLMVRVSELRGESRLTLYGLLANGDADTTFGSGGAIEFSSEELVWRGSEVTGDQQRITIRGVRTCRDPGACSLQGFISVVNTTFVARANATWGGGQGGQGTGNAGGAGASGGGQGGQGTGNAGGAGASGGSSAVAGTTVAAPSALDAKATSRGVVVTWKASSTPGASYLVNVVGPETSKQCTVASSAATTCRFRRIPAWEKYSISVLASAGNAVSEGVTTSVKPFVSVKPRKTVKLSRLITSPRAKNEGRRMWSVRGGCRIDTVKGTMTAGPKAGSCTVKLVTGRSGGLPRISRSVTVMVG